ncbi:SHOCT domain-containing protein [Halovenus sp. HT40]|uniref:SHOCT domain-containing protein n=1 Tax=Halovenus sp. HT40 TaxID=3126691 RepID=UPI00300F3AE1
MTDDSVRERARANASGIAAVVVTGTWLGMLMLDFASELWLAVMLFGYIAVVPVVSMLFDEEEEAEFVQGRQTARTDSEPADADGDDALERLRRRYADGELTDEQFERKLERLLETETLEDVESHARESRSPARDRDASESERSRDRSMERE